MSTSITAQGKNNADIKQSARGVQDFS